MTEGPVTSRRGILPAILAELHRDTPKDEIKQRKALRKNGSPVIDSNTGEPMMLDYVDARYVEKTLDDIVGAENWQNVFQDAASGGVRCGIGILISFEDDTSAWVWKWDVGDASDIEPIKGAHSDAFKRAAVQWGIARDLYDPTPAAEPAPPAERRPVRDRADDDRDADGYRRDSRPAPAPRAAKVRVNPDDAPWACPDHGEVEIVPAGVSKRTQRPYKAFYACPERDCDQKGPSVEARSNGAASYRDDRD